MATDPTVAVPVIVSEVQKRWHFAQTDNILNYIPDCTDLEAAVWDGVDDINDFTPNTTFSVSQIFDNVDTRWKSLLYLASAKNIVQMLLNLWTQNGFDAVIGELNAPSKLGDYQSLYSTLVEEFDKKADRLKRTSQKFVRGISSADGNIRNYIYGNSPFISVFNSRIRIR